MVTAIKFDDVVALGKTACHPDGRHRRLGARGGHADFLHGWHPFADGFRHIDLVGIRDAEGNAVFGDAVDGVGDGDWCVAEDVWPPRADVVDVGFVIDIGDAAAFGAADKKWLAIDIFEGTHWAVDSAGDVLLGDCEKFAGKIGHAACSTLDRKFSSVEMRFRSCLDMCCFYCLRVLAFTV